MCFMGWIFELVGTTMTFLTPTLHNLGFHNLYYPDAIVMFLVIPFFHVINEEEIKGIIAEKGWQQGFMYMLRSQSNI